jgi:hypothetical protein
VVVDAAEVDRMLELKQAMDAEISAFQANDCIETVQMLQVPRGENLVTTRWFFTIKTKEDGSKRYKARLVSSVYSTGVLD